MKKEKLLELFASVASIAGVFTIALGYHPLRLHYRAVFFMVASIVYAVADVVGIIHWKQGV